MQLKGDENNRDSTLDEVIQETRFKGMETIYCVTAVHLQSPQEFYVNQNICFTYIMTGSL